MGPQSGSCGYRAPPRSSAQYRPLQWVHSLVAVVIATTNQAGVDDEWLQWVHSLVAVVILLVHGPGHTPAVVASMGPQSGSCGYSSRRTWRRRRCLRFNGSTVW